MLDLLCHIFMFVDERVLASPRAGNIGVLFDESLCMVTQVQSSFYHLRKIRLIRKHLTFDAAQLLVQALVTSKLDYCNSLLYGLPKNVIKQLQRVQNAAARVVTLSPKFCHIKPVLANLLWLRIEFNILIVTYKTLHGFAPAYTKDLLQSSSSRHGISGLQRIVVPAFNNIKSYGRRAFSVAAPPLWNSLPQHIRNAGSLTFLKDS